MGFLGRFGVFETLGGYLKSLKKESDHLIALAV